MGDKHHYMYIEVPKTTRSGAMDPPTSDQLDAFKRDEHDDQREDEDDVVAQLEVLGELSEPVEEQPHLVVDGERVELRQVELSLE